jgi:hypothetical protein
VERERELVWRADLGDQRGQSFSQVSDRSLLGGAVAHGTDTGPQLGGRTPDTVFILFAAAAVVAEIRPSQRTGRTSRGLAVLSRGRTAPRALARAWPVEAGRPCRLVSQRVPTVSHS